MASKAKVTKAVRNRKKLKTSKNRTKKVQKTVFERVQVLKALEAAVK